MVNSTPVPRQCVRRVKTYPGPKNRVWGFRAKPSRTHRVSAPRSLQPRRENRTTATKTASGVRYYGYRFYDPVTGRWPSRDPLGENWATGEFNEYAFVNNEAVAWIDFLGLSRKWSGPVDPVSGTKPPPAGRPPHERRDLVKVKPGKLPNTKSPDTNPTSPTRTPGGGIGGGLIEGGQRAKELVGRLTEADAKQAGRESCKEQMKKSGDPYGCCEIAWEKYNINPMDITNSSWLIFPKGGLFHGCKRCSEVRYDRANSVQCGSCFRNVPTHKTTEEGDRANDHYYGVICGKPLREMGEAERNDCWDKMKKLSKAGLLTHETHWEDM